MNTELLKRIDENIDEPNKIDMMGGHLFGDKWLTVFQQLKNALPCVDEASIRIAAQSEATAPDIMLICRSLVSELDEVPQPATPPAPAPTYPEPAPVDEYEEVEVEEEVPEVPMESVAEEIISKIVETAKVSKAKLDAYLVGTEIAEGANPENPSEGATKITEVALIENGLEITIDTAGKVEKLRFEGKAAASPVCLSLLRDFLTESGIALSEDTTSCAIPLTMTIPMKKVKSKVKRKKVVEATGEDAVKNQVNDALQLLDGVEASNVERVEHHFEVNLKVGEVEASIYVNPEDATVEGVFIYKDGAEVDRASLAETSPVLDAAIHKFEAILGEESSEGEMNEEPTEAPVEGGLSKFQTTIENMLQDGVDATFTVQGEVLDVFLTKGEAQLRLEVSQDGCCVISGSAAKSQDEVDSLVELIEFYKTVSAELGYDSSKL